MYRDKGFNGPCSMHAGTSTNCSLHSLHPLHLCTQQSHIADAYWSPCPLVNIRSLHTCKYWRAVSIALLQHSSTDHCSETYQQAQLARKAPKRAPRTSAYQLLVTVDRKGPMAKSKLWCITSTSISCDTQAAGAVPEDPGLQHTQLRLDSCQQHVDL